VPVLLHPAAPPPSRAPARPSGSRALEATLALAVAIAVADSSIVVLALPDLYGKLGTSIEGIAWVITGYNVAVAAAALALVPLMPRLAPARLLRSGLALFALASAACAAAPDLGTLIATRLVQGLGAAALLAGALPVLRALSRDPEHGGRRWMTAAALGAALGPALGGILTELADWRAIFLAQAPVAAAALVFRPGQVLPPLEATEGQAPLRPALWPNLGLVAVFGALVGALFLAVLLVVTVWGYSPGAGAGVLSALPLGTIAVGRVGPDLPPRTAAAAGGSILALGLVALALLPSTGPALAVLALGVCGAGLGLCLPPLSRAAAPSASGAARSGTLSIGMRHVGLVLALVLVAPLLAGSLETNGRRATVAATAVVLEGDLPLRVKIPIALELRDAFARARAGEIPDLGAAFDRHGAGNDARVAQVRDDLARAVEATLTRAFRPSFLLSALFAALSLVPALAGRRWP
jgi:predicted MFS family arabinose efflux permease